MEHDTDIHTSEDLGDAPAELPIPMTRDGLDPVAKLMRRARLELPCRLTKYEAAYIASVIIRQNLQVQVLSGLLAEHDDTSEEE